MIRIEIPKKFKIFLMLLVSFVFSTLLACKGKSEQGIEINLPVAQHPLPEKGELLYQNSLAEQALVADWVMEGPGELEFENGWMHMRAHGL